MLPEKIIEVDPEVAEALLGEVTGLPTGLVTVAGSRTQAESPTRTILFTDIVDSTAITQRLGDAKAMELVRAHDSIVRDALRANGGRAVKHTGDGIMAAFKSAVAGVHCAIAVQRTLRDRAAKPSEHRLRVRIGLASGEPVEERGDLFGAAVQLAARLCAQAKPDEILVASNVVELCAGESMRFGSGRELQLKGFAMPANAHLVEWS
jgi:class 3 adenylate cyclase